jgi:hypothetical protein
MTVPTNIKDAVVDILERLPVDQQQDILTFAEFIKFKNSIKRPRKSLKGMWADMDIHITEEDIKEVRREMWVYLDEKFADL